MHIFLVVNSKAADALAVMRQSAARLRAAGHRVDARATFEGGDARRFAVEAAETGAELLVACGGDGTIHEVVNGLCAWADGGGGREEAGSAPRLGIVPLGTANDLGAGLGIPDDPVEALALALVGCAAEVDVGVVNGRCFLNVSTGGFGAEASEGAPGGTKRVLGPLAYLLSGVREFVEMEAVRGTFTGDGEVLFEGRALLWAVGNGRRTGGGNFLTPQARMTDGLLDVCVVPELTHVEFAALAPQLRAGRHAARADVVYRQVRRLVVEVESPVQVNADGEPQEGRRFDYSIHPRRLTVMVPEIPLPGQA